MSEFEEYIKNKYPEDYAVLSTMYLNQAMEELYPDKFEVWQHQQAKIEKLENELSTTKQVLGNVIDMEVAKVDNLKAQLNNMEACYIDMKKECEGLQGRIDVSKSSQPKLHKTDIGDCLHFSTTMFHDGKATCFDCDAVVNHKRDVISVMQTKALRGAND